MLPVSCCIGVDYFRCGGPRHGVANARRLRLQLEALGPAFVKMGQAVAAREDVLGEHVSAEMRKLCDAVAPFPSELVTRILAEELGAAAPRIDREPVAAASLGQVYRISLDGKDYALKVQRPDLANRIAVDVVILDGFVSFVGRVYSCFAVSSVDFGRITRAWSQTLWYELDYVREARSVDKMRAALLCDVKGLVIPKVYWGLTTTRVLTTDWVNGARITTDLGRIKPHHIKIGVEAFASMVLDIGFVHADPHAGNVLITIPGDEVCLLDFGMTCEVPSSHRTAWAKCLFALVRRDHASVLNSLIEIGFFPPDCPRDRIMQVMPKIWDELVSCGSSTAKRKVAVRNCFKEFNVLAFELEFDMPDYYVALARAMLTLEGIAIAADIDFDIFQQAFPMVRRHLLRQGLLAAEDVGRQARGLASASLQAAGSSLGCCKRSARGEGDDADNSALAPSRSVRRKALLIAASLGFGVAGLGVAAGTLALVHGSAM